MIVLPEQERPPYTVALEVRANRAWATKASEVIPDEDEPGADYWEFTVRYPIERLELTVDGSENLNLKRNTPMTALRLRGPGARYEKMHEDWDATKGCVVVEDLEPGESFRLSWLLA
jgi:hypothetical protein